MKGTGKKSKGKRKVSNLKGNLRQKTKDGSYYYRLTIANGRRKEFALKTADLEKARKIDKSRKMVTQNQVNCIHKFAEEGKFTIRQICEKYGVSDITRLNQAQAQEIFDANNKIKNGNYHQNNG